MSDVRYPPCPVCSRPLYPLTDSAIGCIECGRKVTATREQTAAACVAAKADGIAPLDAQKFAGARTPKQIAEARSERSAATRERP